MKIWLIWGGLVFGSAIAGIGLAKLNHKPQPDWNPITQKGALVRYQSWFGNLSMEGPPISQFDPKASQLLLSCRKGNGQLDLDRAHQVLPLLPPAFRGYLRVFMDFQTKTLVSHLDELRHQAPEQLSAADLSYFINGDEVHNEPFSESGEEYVLLLNRCLPQCNDEMTWCFFISKNQSRDWVNRAAQKFPHSVYLRCTQIEKAVEFSSMSLVRNQFVNGAKEAQHRQECIEVALNAIQSNPNQPRLYMAASAAYQLNHRYAQELYCLLHGDVKGSTGRDGPLEAGFRIKQIQAKGIRPQPLEPIASPQE